MEKETVLVQNLYHGPSERKPLILSPALCREKGENMIVYDNYSDILEMLAEDSGLTERLYAITNENGNIYTYKLSEDDFDTEHKARDIIRLANEKKIVVIEVEP